MAVTKSYGLTTDGGVVDLPGTVTVADTLPDQTGNTGKFLKTDGSIVAWDTPAAPSSGGGVPYVYPNLLLTVPTGLRYGKDNRGIIELAPNTTFLTQADAKANPPKNWAWQQSTNYSNLASASVASGILSATGRSDTTYDLIGNTVTAPALYRLIPSNYYEAIFRHKWSAGTVSPQTVKFRIASGTSPIGGSNTYISFEVDDAASGGGGSGNFYIRSTNGNTIASTSGGKPGVGTLRTGLWFKLNLYGPHWNLAWNTANQDTPPSTGWTHIDNQPGNTTNEYANRGYLAADTYLVFTMSRGNDIGPTFELRYFADRIGPDFASCNSDGWRDYHSADGFGTGADMLLTLVSDQDIGATSTITDADIRTVLTNITNTRGYDAAAITYSVVRSAALSAVPDTYQAPGSVVTSGSGKYINIFAKVADTTRLLQGSIYLPGLRIPFTAA